MRQLDTLYRAVEQITDAEKQFNTLSAAPLNWYIKPEDIEELDNIAFSLSLENNQPKKRRMYDAIMYRNNFRRLAKGTNRMVYDSEIHPEVVIKIGLDMFGNGDSPREFKNQQLLSPFCCKVFECSHKGAVGLIEHIDPIKTWSEFMSFRGEVFSTIQMITKAGEYLIDDIGADTFLNYGIRKGFGAVLCDYPYVYKRKSKILRCTQIDPFGLRCTGEVDWSSDYGSLRCPKCGKKYRMRDFTNDVFTSEDILKQEQLSILSKLSLMADTVCEAFKDVVAGYVSEDGEMDIQYDMNKKERELPEYESTKTIRSRKESQCTL